MWLTLDDTSIIATGTNFKSAIPDYAFRVFFMDKINIQENYLDANGFQSDNSVDILSDTIQYLQDLITEIQQDWTQYGVMISSDVNFSPVIDETQDKSTGVSASITLRTRQVNCIIPESITTNVSVYSQVLSFTGTPNYNSIQYRCDGTQVQACYSIDNQNTMVGLVNLFNTPAPNPLPPSCNTPSFCYCWTNYGTYYDNGDGRIRCEMPISIYNTLCPNGTLTLNVIND